MDIMRSYTVHNFKASDEKKNKSLCNTLLLL